jgi:hypothetical protein
MVFPCAVMQATLEIALKDMELNLVAEELTPLEATEHFAHY